MTAEMGCLSPALIMRGAMPSDSKATSSKVAKLWSLCTLWRQVWIRSDQISRSVVSDSFLEGAPLTGVRVGNRVKADIWTTVPGLHSTAPKC